MTDGFVPSASTEPHARALGAARPPGVVQTAAVITWVAATGTAILTMFLSVVFLAVASSLFETFDQGSGNPRWFLVGGTAVVVVLAVAADVAAILVVRRSRWARWALAGLSVVAAVLALMAAYYVVPLTITAAAVTVIVLLFTPSSRAWFRSDMSRRQVSQG